VSNPRQFIRHTEERQSTPAPDSWQANSRQDKGESDVKFLSLYKTVERNAPPGQEEMDKMGKLIEEGMKAGWLLAVEGCMPSAKGARVRKPNG
jgi:hypothetical protein